MVPLHTAPCGIYCPDCILHRNAFQAPAKELRKALDAAGMEPYAKVQSPFGSRALAEYPAFLRVLDALSAMQCQEPCRQGGGCSGQPCEIMRCCRAKDFTGCWECADLDACGKFEFLAPRCGDMPRDNCRVIRKHGPDNWEERRAKFYVWL